MTKEGLNGYMAGMQMNQKACRLWLDRGDMEGAINCLREEKGDPFNTSDLEEHDISEILKAGKIATTIEQLAGILEAYI